MPSFTNKVITKFTGINMLSRVLKKMGDDGTRSAKRIKRGNDVLKQSFLSVKNVVAGMVIGGAINKGFGFLREQVSGVTEEFIAFDHALGKAAAKLDIARGSAEWKQLEEKARAIGGSTEFTNTQVAKSMDVLATSGFTLDQVLSSVGGSADVASIATLELDQATQIAADTLNAFGLRANDATTQMQLMERASNAIARTAVSSAVDIGQIHEALADSGWAANAASQDIESYMSLVGLLGNGMIRGSKAATVLKNSFLGLTGMTTEARRHLTKLGISVAYSSDKVASAFGKRKGDMRNAVEILADLSEKMKDMGNVQKLVMLKELFGKYGAGIQQILKVGGDKIVEFRDKFIQSGKTAKDVADDIRNSIQNKLAVIESQKIELGFKFLDKIKDKLPGLIDRMGDFINSIDPDKVIAKGEKIVGAIEGVIDTVVSLKNFLIGLGTAWGVTKVLAFVSAIKAATVASLAFIATPFGAILLALTSIVNLILTIKDNWNELGRAWDYIVDGMSKKFIGFMLKINTFLRTNAIGQYVAEKFSIKKEALERTDFQLRDMLADGALSAKLKMQAENVTNKYRTNNYNQSSETNQETFYEPWAIEPPNRNELSQRATWEGTLNIKNAPKGTTLQQRSQGAPPLSVEGLGEAL